MKKTNTHTYIRIQIERNKRTNNLTTNETKQNKTKQNKTKQNKTNQMNVKRCISQSGVET